MGARRHGLQAAAGAAAARAADAVPDEIWLTHPKLGGHPAGIGWGPGRAVVVNCECELVARGARRHPDDPRRRACAQPYPAAGRAAWWRSSAARPRISPRSRASAAFRRCSACSTRRRPFPMARRSRSTASPASCGGSHEARAATRIFVTQPIADSAIARLRALGSVKVYPDDSRIIAKKALIAAREAMRHSVLPAARPDRPRGDRGQSQAAPHRGAVDLAVQHRRRGGDRAQAFR